jgi:acetyl-CoA carboxylase biotin carboxylase subunit
MEFLLDGRNKFYFMEVNTRVQVEHPVTEQVMGLDIVREQIKIAAGEPMTHPKRVMLPRGHAIECRINAEDPYAGFRPSPGRISHLHLPGGLGIRVDTHIYEGYSVPPNYDSLLAKVIASAATREEAINRMLRALDECVLEGVATTIPFLRRILGDKRFQEGRYSTHFAEAFIKEIEREGQAKADAS